MSLTQNQEWINNAYENFTEALKEKNVELLKAIIADTFDAGFPDEARSMALQLRNENI